MQLTDQAQRPLCPAFDETLQDAFGQLNRTCSFHHFPISCHEIRRDQLLSVFARVRALADFSASWSMYARLAWVAMAVRISGSRTPSGSTCFSKRARNDAVAGAVRPVRSAVFAQEACAAIRARRSRCCAVNAIPAS